MIKARTWISLLLLSAGTIAATASCGSDEATGGGAGAGSLIGAAGDGNSGGAVGRAGAGSSEAGAPATSTGALGTECSTDLDCSSGLTCITSDSTTFDGGGPSRGMCTLSCASDGDCTAVEVGAACLNLFGTTTAPKPFCFEGCTLGDDATGTTVKCQGRPDFACRDFGDPTVSSVPDPFCAPQCRADIECGTGLFCNTGSGLCSKVKPTGALAGAPCHPGAATATCKGACIGIPDPSDPTAVPVNGFCADICSGYSGCMFPSDPNANPGGLCAGALSDPFGLGDIGYCEPSCACTSDCKIAGDVCRAWQTSESAFQKALGAAGLCYPNATGSVELSCGEGGSTGTTEPSAGAGGTSGAGN